LIELHVTRRDDDPHPAGREHTFDAISARYDVAFANRSVTVEVYGHPTIESKGRGAAEQLNPTFYSHGLVRTVYDKGR